MCRFLQYRPSQKPLFFLHNVSTKLKLKNFRKNFFDEIIIITTNEFSEENLL